MRSFQLLFWLLFLGFYALVSVGSYHSLKDLLLGNKYYKSLRYYAVLTIILVISLVFLYIWPGRVSETKNYDFYFIFNGIFFIDVVVKIPLALSFLFALPFKRKMHVRKTIRYCGFIISLALIIILVIGSTVGRNKIMTKEIDLEFSDLPESFIGTRLAHLSDLHVGNYLNSKSVLKKSIKTINQANVDFICFTGDLVNNFSQELVGWDTVFTELTESHKAYSILGNHDYGDYSDWKNDSDKANNFNKIIESHSEFGFKLLRNQHDLIHNGKDSIYMVGVENWGHPPFPQYAELEKALEGIPQDAFKILLTHDPAHWESKIKNREDIALSLSGHSHGLQLGFKNGGITYSLAWLTRKTWGGLYQSTANFLYVNTGLGTVGMPWRIDMPGEITIITLKRSEINGKQ